MEYFFRCFFSEIKKKKIHNTHECTAWNVSVFGVILVSIFPHSDWIRRDADITPCSYPMRENVDQNNSEYGHLLCSDGYYSFLSTVQASSFKPCLLNFPFLIPLKTEKQRFQNGTLERKGLKKTLRIFPVIFFSDINPFVPSMPFRERMLWERII